MNITCPDKNAAYNAAQHWITGGNATHFEVVYGEFSVFVRARADKAIVRTFSW